MYEHKRIEVKVNLTEISSSQQARIWANSPSFLDSCTDTDHRWFFDGGEDGSCFLVLHYLPFQAPKIRAAAYRLLFRMSRASADLVYSFDVEECLKLALGVELATKRGVEIHG